MIALDANLPPAALRTIFGLARKYRVPVWLLRQYNPDLDFGALRTGASMVVPQIEPRSS